MPKKVKRLTATILCTLLLLTLCSSFLQAYAFTNISSTTTGISISGGNGSVICAVAGYQTFVTKCSIKASLQQYKNGSWVTIATWQQSFGTFHGSLTGTAAITKGYDYRTQAIYTATSAAMTESFTTYSGVKHY
ncbi:MAG: hypothetical protein FWC27_02845 [Firmicutes bacterium]|nr:hypothetical protein [Bacillota bacterium]